MALVLPVDQVSAWFTFECELEGASYGFEFRWNDRMSVWVCSISDGEGGLLAAGIKCVINAPLLRGFRTLLGLPPGELFIRDTQGIDEDPGFEDLGRRSRVLYLLSSELAGG